MKATFSLALLVLFGGAMHADASNLVTNGSFEEGTLGIGSFQGWQTTLGDAATFVDSSGATGPLYGEAIDGLWAAYFGTTAANGGSSTAQVLATTPGQSYLLSFDLANDNAGLPASNSFVASINGAPAVSFSGLAAQNYAYEQYFFVASSNSTRLSFSAFNDQSYSELDGVSVAPVPEPLPFILWPLGALFIGAAGKRFNRVRIR